MPANKKCNSEPWPSLDGVKIEQTAPLPLEDFSCPQVTERPASETARSATHPAPLGHRVALPPVPNVQITYACCERPSQRGSRKHGYQLHVHGDPAKYSPKWITRHAFTMYELANICDTQVRQTDVKSPTTGTRKDDPSPRITAPANDALHRHLEYAQRLHPITEQGKRLD